MKLPVQLTTILILLLCGATVTAQNHVIWSGGIGADERAEAPNEGTRLVFALQSGAFLSRVQVSITNSQGEEVVNTVTNGPWLVLDLPDGQYSVVASLENRDSITGSFTVGGQQREFIISFRD